MHNIALWEECPICLEDDVRGEDIHLYVSSNDRTIECRYCGYEVESHLAWNWHLLPNVVAAEYSWEPTPDWLYRQ